MCHRLLGLVGGAAGLRQGRFTRQVPDCWRPRRAAGGSACNLLLWDNRHRAQDLVRRHGSRLRPTASSTGGRPGLLQIVRLVKLGGTLILAGCGWGSPPPMSCVWRLCAKMAWMQQYIIRPPSPSRAACRVSSTPRRAPIFPAGFGSKK